MKGAHVQPWASGPGEILRHGLELLRKDTDICAERSDGKWIAKAIGIFGRDRHPEELRVLRRFVKNSAFELETIDEFRRKVFLKYLKASALIVAYDAPCEISRIAVKSNKSLKHRRGFSFYFRLFKDKKTGKVRPSGYEPGLSIESLDASKAIYRLIKYKFHEMDAEREEEEEKEQDASVHFLDLKTLTNVLTGEVHSFPSACEIFGAPASRSRMPLSRVTKLAIETLLRNVTAELELLNRLSEEFDRYGLDVAPERCYSPATLAKALLGNGNGAAREKIQYAAEDSRDRYASGFRRPCGMHDQTGALTCRLRRFSRTVSGGEQSDGLRRNTSQ